MPADAPACRPCAAIEPAAVDAVAAARLCGITKSTWYRLCSADRVPRPFKLGGRVLWRVAELRAWIDAGAPPAEKWERMKCKDARR